MEVTDSRIKLAMNAYCDVDFSIGTSVEVQQYDRMKAALEAVFDSMEKDGSGWVKITGTLGSNPAKHVTISYASELFEDMAPSADNSAQLKQQAEAMTAQPEPDEGWIEWREAYCPNLPIGTRIEVKCYNGELLNDFIGHAKDNVKWRNVIAYRIIKEELKQQCHINKTREVGDGYHVCEKCGMGYWKKAEPKEDIPTLMEFHRGAKHPDWATTICGEVLSEYLTKYMARKE